MELRAERKRESRRGYFASILILASCLLMLGCEERPTKVAVEGGNPPRFLMSGSGTLVTLRIRSPQRQREADGEAASLYWVIEASKGMDQPVVELSPLVYGEVPDGYIQRYPEHGKAPNLLEGERYFVQIYTFDAPGIAGYLTVQDGKASFEEYP